MRAVRDAQPWSFKVGGCIRHSVNTAVLLRNEIVLAGLFVNTDLDMNNNSYPSLTQP
jgi:hypothetical protein